MVISLITILGLMFGISLVNATYFCGSFGLCSWGQRWLLAGELYGQKP